MSYTYDPALSFERNLENMVQKRCQELASSGQADELLDLKDKLEELADIAFVFNCEIVPDPDEV